MKMTFCVWAVNISFIVDEECDHYVNVVVTQYDGFLSKLLDKHAPLKEIDVERQLNDWMTDEISLLKKFRRKKEVIWRKHPIAINFDIYIASCEAVKNAIDSSKAELLQRKIIDCTGNQKTNVQNYGLTARSQKTTRFTRIFLRTQSCLYD